MHIFVGIFVFRDRKKASVDSKFKELNLWKFWNVNFSNISFCLWFNNPDNAVAAHILWTIELISKKKKWREQITMVLVKTEQLIALSNNILISIYIHILPQLSEVPGGNSSWSNLCQPLQNCLFYHKGVRFQKDNHFCMSTK